MKEVDFSQLLKEFEPLIYHLIKKYGIRDPEDEFYQEAAISLWQAYQSYDKEKAKFSTYAYYCISRTLCNLIAKDQKEIAKKEKVLSATTFEDLLVENKTGIGIDAGLLKKIRTSLTDNQWKWFLHFVIEDKSIKEIAGKENVTEDAVKNWGRLAKKKVQKILVDEEYVERRL
ncbi:sigma-70 family RNA polymerase sigma factor [Saliterribacillus persicus]|uniref:RNA polymerase sigma factor (Sigma-70 family) n=1 Tax=Saliterribacillus persicus TaxID=930114 RepID=A0A368YAQ5_9BACI|nr:sigma-70 family RNA polymerase sigma factor [Saliterribacillus persicus]RCW77340.1 RNA polymerase sigma factor (sigma-70 family) [Saliterribacillus persicus]